MPSRTEELPTVVRRISAGQMLMAGSPVGAVAEALHLSTATVKRYKAMLDSGGLDALKKMSIGGRSSALDAAALERAAAALRGSAREHGFPSDAWTNVRLRELIAARFGVQYSRVYAWQIATNLGLGHRLSKSSRWTNPLPSSAHAPHERQMSFSLPNSAGRVKERYNSPTVPIAWAGLSVAPGSAWVIQS